MTAYLDNYIGFRNIQSCVTYLAEANTVTLWHDLNVGAICDVRVRVFHQRYTGSGTHFVVLTIENQSRHVITKNDNFVTAFHVITRKNSQVRTLVGFMT